MNYTAGYFASEDTCVNLRGTNFIHPQKNAFETSLLKTKTNSTCHGRMDLAKITVSSYCKLCIANINTHTHFSHLIHITAS